MIVTRAISLTNFLVASSALGFQVFVLYPWHKELDAGFEDLKKEHLKVLDAVGNSLSKQQRKTLTNKLNELKSQSPRSFTRRPVHLLTVFGSTHFITTHAPGPGEAIRAARDKIMPAKDKPSMGIATTEKIVDISLYAKYALAGAFCCPFTHAVLTPVDVVKTRIQLDPTTYSRSLWGSARQIASLEGPGAFLTGLGPTVAGYCLQGAFKFGGYEFFKAHVVDYLGYSTAVNNRNAVYLTSAAAAEFFGDIALCPFESVRIRLVSQPTYANDFVSALAKMAREEGLSGLYSGLSPVLLKQIPYTMATFLVYEKSIQTAYTVIEKAELSPVGVTGINLGTGLVAGLAAAVVSQPADTILSKVNKEKGQRGEGTARRLARIATGLGLRGAFTGMRARLVMVGGMTAVQFGIYGDTKKVCLDL
ncbi:mitochondrial phosphate carrier protein [Ilyonectria robusta]|uniref:mitochondrial phosphate carrier protein n=1 Tax=Ilyonectria robusta TaxID=1079257 RepID=UPI001E8D06DE|nr:mitochondrial phosphate carrier protein [Ilyonectria robusta]KAH8662788.1 mitochondrial phosphate carrier protein [Ilyonectria robusta]